MKVGAVDSGAAAPERAGANPADDANAVRQPDRRRPGAIVGLLHAELRPNPNNPRRHFDQQDLEDFASELARDGLLQNLVVRELFPKEGEILAEIIAGERRWRAIGIAIARGEWEPGRVIPCQVKKIEAAHADVLSIVENLQRVQLDPIEEAKAFQRLREAHHMGTDEIARRVGKTQRFVQQRLQLLELGETDRQAVSDRKLTVEGARRQVARQNAGDASPARPPASKAGGGGATAELTDAARQALSYDHAIDVLFAVDRWPKNGVTALQSAIRVWMDPTAIGRRLTGLAAAGLVDQPRAATITEAGRQALAVLDAKARERAAAPPAAPPALDTRTLLDVIDQKASAGAAALERARAGALAKVTERPAAAPIGALADRAEVIAELETRLKVARDAERGDHDIIAGIRKITHEELWQPAAAAAFLDQVLRALRPGAATDLAAPDLAEPGAAA